MSFADPKPPLPAEIAAQATALADGLAQLGLNLSGQQQQQLLVYLALFDKWNRAYNLSAVRDPASMVSRHLLDSLAVAPYLRGRRYIDVGSGGGLPGIPLAIAFPQRHFTLLDSNGKKTRFLFQVKVSLGLANVAVENCRVEQFQPRELYDGVLSRAFASLAEMVSGCAHLLDENGAFWALKGIWPENELSALEKRYKVCDSHALVVPGCEGERHLLVIVPDQNTRSESRKGQ